MKNKKLIIIGIISVILIVAGLVTSYIDSARVRNSIEPKFTIKIASDGGNKITYWGLGYKVIRYPSVSPNEPYKNNLGVKYGSWFMRYELSNYESIDVKLPEDNKVEKEYIENFEVSGYLKISKYNLDIPVLKEATARSLEVSAAIIYGNGLNEIGNTTITGLYSKGDSFENIHKLEIGDEIIVVDQKKEEIIYEVYDKRNVKSSDSDYMVRDTNNKREITLHTGNYSNSINDRLIILAKEKE